MGKKVEYADRTKNCGGHVVSSVGRGEANGDVRVAALRFFTSFSVENAGFCRFCQLLADFVFCKGVGKCKGVGNR